MQREDNTRQLRALDPGSTGYEGRSTPGDLDEAIDEAERVLRAIDAELRSIRAEIGMPDVDAASVAGVPAAAAKNLDEQAQGVRKQAVYLTHSPD